MSVAPFARLDKSIPVTVVTGADAVAPAPGAALITMEPSRHAHEDGAQCPACAAHGDVRAMLFDLMERVRRGMAPAFTSVIVDARRADDPQAVIDRLVPGRQPALGLRDHTVARSFHLA